MRFWLALPASLALCAAYLLGRVMTQTSAVPVPLQIVDDPRPLSATIVLQSWNAGMLRGVVRGSGRIIAGNRAVVIRGSGAFAVQLELPKTAPPATASGYGGGFVASSRGKKYYPAGSPAAAKLSPKNILYFATRADAEAAGYAPP